jgi:CRISPR-associated protein Csm3
MARFGHRILIGKIFFKGQIILKTGLHIGGSQESMQIGGIDLPVLKDSAKGLPYIPGSSMKGKLRSTLEKFGERQSGSGREKVTINRDIGSGGNSVQIHVCETAERAMQCDVCRIFGATGDRKAVPEGQKAYNFPSVLFVRDSMLDSEKMDVSALLTEEKVETGIDRTSMAANPRRIERVLPDTKFNFEMVLNVESISFSSTTPSAFKDAVLKQDLTNILTCMSIIQDEGLGGYTSRGYGKVEFQFTEFLAKSINFFKGDLTKLIGKVETTTPFNLETARTEIENLVNFLKEESNRVLAH